MTRKQRLIIAAVCTLLLLFGTLIGTFLLRRHDPIQEIPTETTATASETTTERIQSTEQTTETSLQTTAPTETAASITTAAETSVSTETEQTTATETTTAETTAVITAEVIPMESITLSFHEIQLYIGESATPSVTIHPPNASDKMLIWTTYDNNVASISGNGCITAKAEGQCRITVASAGDPNICAEILVTVLMPPPTDPPTEPPTLPPTEPPATEAAPAVTDPPTEPPTEPPTDPPVPSGPTYIGGILIANKTYALPADYNPGLDPTCEAQFNALRNAAAAEGLNIYFASGFRSYDYQANLYNRYVSIHGQEKADTFSARAGHSEHQTGLAIDVNTVTDSFAYTAEAAWLADHAHEFGFIIRYPKGKEHITGYKYEPWHIRYLGIETATEVYNSGLTLEEYLGITSCYAY